ncbi:MAG: FAD-dependent oxidoreductase [Bacillota bacterium]|nr:FAD-dependent oxidoreductase [Bacillota bacterium]MDP4172001.1 FAD-dependent oxidoreductase [Bacillota bacterium]
MDLHNGSLFWPTTAAETFHERKKLPIDDHYDVLIIGGGMSGALCAYTLLQENLKIALVDKRVMATGSSSANTGLLQFSNDIMLFELIEQIGEEKAVRFYKLCQSAIGQLENIANTAAKDSDFIRRKSICFASTDEDIKKVQKEYAVLKKHGFPVSYWTEEDMKQHLPFSKPAALITHGDAEVNPFTFVRGILDYVEHKGGHLFENAEVTNVTEKKDHVSIETSIGTFHASQIIYAIGYETPPIGEKIGADINRSYAIATQPIDDLSEWEGRSLIWETKRPYLYMRTTADGRIIAGGLDEDEPEAPQSEDWINNRAHRLKQEIEKLFPMMDIQIAYAWGASFGESLDNLPFIGKHPDKKRQYYLLGYGGNGTVYSMLGSHILKDLILQRPNPDAEIVKLDR